LDEHLQAFCSQIRPKQNRPGGIATWTSKASDQT
jgi:hypothetical protein